MESSERLSLHHNPSWRCGIDGDTSEVRSRPRGTERGDSTPVSSGRADSLAHYCLLDQNPFADADDERGDPVVSKNGTRCSSREQHEDISTVIGPFCSTSTRHRLDEFEGISQAVASGVETSIPLASSNHYFRSRRIKRADIQRPWLDRKNPREKWLTINPLIGLFIGICIAGLLIWDGIHTVVNHQYCLILDENFSQGLDMSTWTFEVELGGFG